MHLGMRQLGSVWPKQLTAVITAVIFGEITAETLSEILTSYGLSPKLLFTAETAIFGLNLRTWWYRACLTHSGEYHHVQVRPQYMAEKSHFRPKMAVSAINNSFGRKFSYGLLQPNFCFHWAVSYSYGISEKILFRSHTNAFTLECGAWWTDLAVARGKSATGQRHRTNALCSLEYRLVLWISFFGACLLGEVPFHEVHSLPAVVLHF